MSELGLKVWRTKRSELVSVALNIVKLWAIISIFYIFSQQH